MPRLARSTQTTHGNMHHGSPLAAVEMGNGGLTRLKLKSDDNGKTPSRPVGLSRADLSYPIINESTWMRIITEHPLTGDM